MKTFTIDTDNNITVHASRKAAKETSLGVFATEEQFADLIGPDNKRLVEIWNSLPGVKPVTKFANRKMATERIWGAFRCWATPRRPQNETANAEPQETFAEQPAAAAEQSVVPPEEPIAETQPEAPVAPTSAEPLAEAGVQAADVAPEQPTPTNETTSAKKGRKAKKAATTKAAATDGALGATGPREGSKTAQVVAMLQREGRRDDERDYESHGLAEAHGPRVHGRRDEEGRVRGRVLQARGRRAHVPIINK